MPSRNQDEFVCQGASTPHNAINVFSIKGILLNCLDDFILAKYKEEQGSFICFSHNRKADLPKESTPCQKSAIAWNEIPLKQKIIDNSCLYISPLPQILVSRGYLNSARSLTSETHQIVEKLNQFQLTTDRPQCNYVGNASNFLSNLWKEVEITSERPGWIVFQLSERGMHYWLEQFQISVYSTRPIHTLVIEAGRSRDRKYSAISRSVNAETHRYSKAHAEFPESPVAVSPTQEIPPDSGGSTADSSVADMGGDSRLWRVQHAFARCCSYTKTVRTTAIKTDPLKADLARQSSAQPFPQPFPQCSSDLSLPATNLVYTLIETVDAMFWTPYQNPIHRKELLLKQADRLCQSFDRLSRLYLRVGIATSTPETTVEPLSNEYQLKAHIDLVQAVQITLKTLLRCYLLEAAPETL